MAGPLAFALPWHWLNRSEHKSGGKLGSHCTRDRAAQSQVRRQGGRGHSALLEKFCGPERVSSHLPLILRQTSFLPHLLKAELEISKQKSKYKSSFIGKKEWQT